MASKYDWRRYGVAGGQQGAGAPQGVGAGSSGQPANAAPPAAPLPRYTPPGYQPITNTHSITEANRQNRLEETNRGNELNQQAGEAFNYYGGQEANYGNQAAGAYGQLQQQPGYTPGQAGQINVDYSKYNTPTSALNQQYLTQQEQGGIAGDPYKAYNQPYQQEQGNISNSFADTYGKQMAGAQTVQSGTAQAAGGMQGGLNAATSTEQGGLNAAANRGDLQVSDQDVANIKDAAGRRVGNQYQSLQEDIGRKASASGLSPAAYSAMMSRYSRESAEQQGQAETEADVAARQYKLGSAQTQAGMQMGAAATGGQAAQNAAYLGGQAGMQAAEAGGQAQMTAGLNTGNQALGEEQHMADLGVNAMQSGEAQAAQRAAALAGNRQSTMQGIQGTQYGQGTNSAQLTAGGAANVGQTAISGQNAYRNYLTGEQQLAQGGQMGALGTQANVYGAQNSGINMAQSNTNSYENGQHAAGVSMLNGILQAGAGLGGAAIAAGGFKYGGVATKPTIATVGEGNSPEAIVKLGASRYSPPTIVDKPTHVMLADHGQPEAVIPLTPRSGNRLQPSMLGTDRYMPRTPQFAPSPYNPNSRSVGPLRSMAGPHGQRITA